jgi:glycosidase
VLRVVLHWVEQGVRIFRVDNPHTKPVDFWHWLIWQVKRQHPDVLFLAEAFTRPAIMHGLGSLGFSQSYTYFTWRTTARRCASTARSWSRRPTTCDPTSGPTRPTSCTRRCSGAAR